jgi:hypothetical protein
MLIIVLILNMLIAGLCWYGVWRIWRLRQTLVKVTAALTLAEQDVRRVLHDAVQTIYQGQTGTAQLRQQYQQVLWKLRQMQQVIALLGLGRLVWQKYERRYGQQVTSDRFVQSAQVASNQPNHQSRDQRFRVRQSR